MARAKTPVLVFAEPILPRTVIPDGMMVELCQIRWALASRLKTLARRSREAKDESRAAQAENVALLLEARSALQECRTLVHRPVPRRLLGIVRSREPLDVGRPPSVVRSSCHVHPKPPRLDHT